MTAWNPCRVCGQLTSGHTCTSHAPDPGRRAAAAPAGWVRLARHALHLHPQCAACGRRAHLQATPIPRAWARRAAGQLVRLADVAVLCDTCNARTGNPRPGTARFATWQRIDGDLEATHPDPTIRTTTHTKGTPR